MKRAFPLIWVLVWLASTVGVCHAGGLSDWFGDFSPPAKRLDGEREAILNRLAELPPLITGHTGPRIGFHSIYLEEDDQPIPIRIDLDREYTIDHIALFPVKWKSGSRLVRGHGFPLRYQVEVSNKTNEWTTIYESSDDEPDVGAAPALVDVGGLEVRRIRVTSLQHRSDARRTRV